MLTNKKRAEVPSEERPSEQELETWYKQTVTKLYRFAYGKLQNHEEAEDITQETYARCLRTYHFKSLPPYAYLKETARNLMNDRFRRVMVQRIEFLDQDIADEKVGEEDITEQTDLRDLLNSLPLDYRLVLQLRIIEGYSGRETAKRMGRSEDAVRGLQYRAMQTLRQLMQQGG